MSKIESQNFLRAKVMGAFLGASSFAASMVPSSLDSIQDVVHLCAVGGYYDGYYSEAPLSGARDEAVQTAEDCLENYNGQLALMAGLSLITIIGGGVAGAAAGKLFASSRRQQDTSRPDIQP